MNPVLVKGKLLHPQDCRGAQNTSGRAPGREGRSLRWLCQCQQLAEPCCQVESPRSFFSSNGHGCWRGKGLNLIPGRLSLGCPMTGSILPPSSSVRTRARWGRQGQAAAPLLAPRPSLRRQLGARAASPRVFPTKSKP